MAMRDKNFIGKDIGHSPSAVRIVYTDAINTGYGGYTKEHGPHVARSGHYPKLGRARRGASYELLEWCLNHSYINWKTNEYVGLQTTRMWLGL